MAKAQAPAIRIPTKFPKIRGLSAAKVEALYVAEREAGLGHVRVMARLNRRSRGEDVPALATLGRFNRPVANA